MEKLSDAALKQLFTEARSYSHWENKEVSENILRELYELVKFGPTSVNGCPMRIVFVKSGSPQKEKLLAALSPNNVEKVKTAPVTAIIAYDEKFYEKLPKLYPSNHTFLEMFATSHELSCTTAFRNSSLQGAYFMLAARSLGLDCGPMSGFDNQILDESFFKDTYLKSNFICSIGYGDKAKLHPRNARLSFDEACKVV